MPAVDSTEGVSRSASTISGHTNATSYADALDGQTTNDHGDSTSTETSSSSQEQEYEPADYDAADQIADIERTITKSTEQDPNNNVLTRLGTLSKTLSHMTASQMSHFTVDKEDFDLQKVLKFLASGNKAHGIEQTTTDVFFEDLTVIGKNSAAAIVQDVGGTFFPFIVKLKQRYSKNSEKLNLSGMSKTRECIRGVTGFGLQGNMTLVLGRPGSGCSTFLKSIAGETQTYVGVEGDVSYNGIPHKTMWKDFPNQMVYVPELDEHFPFLTVQETLEFAIGCKTPAVRVDNVSRKKYISTIKNLYTVLFGLDHVEKTLVGNDFVRGISGGQRKRVSIAEAMAVGGTVYCYDNATRGLDASTALEFVEALRTTTNITQTTAFVTAYQAGESLYELFDYVTVMYLGRQVYFGPREEAVSYFERLGFLKKPRQTSSEYLTSVTDPLEREAIPGFKGVLPKDADEFEQAWRSSPEYAALTANIAERKAAADPKTTAHNFRVGHQSVKMKGSRKTSPYTVNYFEQLKLCFERSWHNIVNNKAYTATSVIVAIVQSLVVGSLYYNTTEESIGAFSRGGIIFFALLFFSLMTLAETSSLFENKPILTKQRSYILYHPSAELLASQCIQIPVRVISIFGFSIILYFLSNMKREAGPFFAFVLFVSVSVQAVNAFFVLMASLCPDLNSANGLTGIAMMMMIMYSSFMIQRPSMYWWFKWFSYMNPVLYGFESLALIEFRGRMMECSTSEIIPYGSSYSSFPNSDRVCGFTGSAQTRELYPDAGNVVSGDIYLNISFQYIFGHCWRNLGILFGLVLGFMFLNAILVEFYNPIVPTADKLLFIRGGHIPKDLAKTAGLDESGSSTDSSDPEKGDVAGEVAQAQTTSEHPQPETTTVAKGQIFASNERLGSDDVFLWKHVDYVVPYEGQARKLLDDVQGWVKPGTLTALMGESGAGKTTLLNVLSRRTDVGVVTGDILINGHPLDQSFERRTGYVQQQDVHIAELTVRESLLFAARLRRPASVPDSEKAEYVEKIMEILHMDDYADAIAGVTGFGLNVEQRKKLSIATELVAKPSLLLFLDEPTSGLDSQSAWAIVQVLRQLAAAGQAILCTIHQPSATLFEQFDRLLLLRRGGQTVYFGKIGENSRDVLGYFESYGARPCGKDENSAEYILEVIGAGATANTDENWNEIWIESSECHSVTTELDSMIAKLSQKPRVESESTKELQSQYAASYPVQFAQVLRRTWMQFYRDMDYIMAKLMLMILAGLIHGFSFWDIKKTIIGMQNTMFAVFIALVMAAPLTNQIQARAIQSRQLFEVRESKSSTFHWACLLFAQFLVELPYSVVFSTIYFICWYFPMKLSHSADIMGVWWLFYCIFFQMYYVSFGLAVVYMATDLPQANVLFGLLFNFVVGFCGVVQVPSLMPGFWKFMWRLSPLTYFVEGLLSVLLHDREIVCSAEEMSYLDPPMGTTCGDFLEEFFHDHSGYVANPTATSKCGVCQYRVGDEYLSTVGMSHSHIWRDVGFYCAYIIFNIVLMLAAYYLLRVRRVSFSLPSFKSSKATKKVEEVKKEQKEEEAELAHEDESITNQQMRTTDLV